MTKMCSHNKILLNVIPLLSPLSLILNITTTDIGLKQNLEPVGIGIDTN